MTIIDLSALEKGDRRVLAKAITLVESREPGHQAQAQQLLAELTTRQSSNHQAIRLGISGAPGVGKSTFIEAFGKQLTQQGLSVAVLAIDPSSPISGGSILGDKTRMARLSRDPKAFIRPTPSAGELGGVTQSTRAALQLCEVAQFDWIIVETVGSGQSEIDVANMTDYAAILIQPESGDGLQGIKKGMLEVADLLIVNKADGERCHAAEKTRQEYLVAMQLATAQSRRHQQQQGTGVAPVQQALCCSALEGEGLLAIEEAINTRWLQLHASGQLRQRRQEQGAIWLKRLLQEQLPWRLSGNPLSRGLMEQLQAQLVKGELTVEVAVERVFTHLFDDIKPPQ